MENNEQTQQMCDTLTTEIKKIFPDCGVSCKYTKFLGDGSIDLAFTFGKDSSEYSNGIINNDDFFNHINIRLVAGNKWNAESSSAASFSRKPNKELPNEKYLAYGRVKTGWRNFSTYDEQVVIKKIIEFYKKVKGLLIENKHQLTETTLKLGEQKGWF